MLTIFHCYLTRHGACKSFKHNVLLNNITINIIEHIY